MVQQQLYTSSSSITTTGEILWSSYKEARIENKVAASFRPPKKEPKKQDWNTHKIIRKIQGFLSKQQTSKQQTSKQQTSKKQTSKKQSSTQVNNKQVNNKQVSNKQTSKQQTSKQQ
jgi:hypothetical protein